MRLVGVLERVDVAWCVIGGIAVNHWAEQPMVTQDVDIVVAVDAVERAVSLLEGAGFRAERFAWSINFKGRSAVNIQLSTEDFYRDYPTRAVAADVHGILMRVASLEDTIRGKIKAWSEPERRQSKKIKDLADIARLVETHPRLWADLPAELRDQIRKPD
ncbi:MAG: nucleotidyl transferase AbiEii/AbiGii toxin family protein [Verrucomicrobiota bacterium]|nr:nucleotidyl transferase AbiEii/AbiGii toxin family protein [Verrucomicrobiota bacterium]